MTFKYKGCCIICLLSFSIYFQNTCKHVRQYSEPQLSEQINCLAGTVYCEKQDANMTASSKLYELNSLVMYKYVTGCVLCRNMQYRKQEQQFFPYIHVVIRKTKPLSHLPTTTSRVHIKYMPLLKQVAY